MATNWAQRPRDLRKPGRVEIRNGEGQTGVEGIRWSLESQLLNIGWDSALVLGEMVVGIQENVLEKRSCPRGNVLRVQIIEYVEEVFIFSKFQGLEKQCIMPSTMQMLRKQSIEEIM